MDDGMFLYHVIYRQMDGHNVVY